jgi:hypothetical protein|eukprot:SAG25_NODE_1143_length_3810_cov_132.786390_2_plen_85_part_00
MSKVYDDTNVPEKPANGSIINGPFLEGCRWNDETELLDESAPKELYTPMPCIWLKPEANRVVSNASLAAVLAAVGIGARSCEIT